MGSGTKSGRASMPRAKDIGDTGYKGYSEKDLQNFVNRIPFKKEGNGEWTIEHPAFGGGQILSGQDRYNPKMTIYEARVWDSNYEPAGKVEEFTSLNEAKDWVKWKLASKFDPTKVG